VQPGVEWTSQQLPQVHAEQYFVAALTQLSVHTFVQQAAFCAQTQVEIAVTEQPGVVWAEQQLPHSQCASAHCVPVPSNKPLCVAQAGDDRTSHPVLMQQAPSQMPVAAQEVPIPRKAPFNSARHVISLWLLHFPPAQQAPMHVSVVQVVPCPLNDPRYFARQEYWSTTEHCEPREEQQAPTLSSKAAVAFRSDVTVTLQVLPVPVHAPLQPAKWE
jgi:hypothetical protein